MKDDKITDERGRLFNMNHGDSDDITTPGTESFSYRCDDFANFARKCRFFCHSRFGQFCCEGLSELITCAETNSDFAKVISPVTFANAHDGTW